MLACLRFAQNPADRIAGFRVLQLVPGIGPATAEALLDARGAASRAPPPRPVPRRAAADWAAFAALLDALRAPPRLAGRARRHPRLVHAPPRAPARGRRRPRRRPPPARGDRRDLPGRERFLTEITLDPPGASSDHAGVPHRDEDYLILSTIHSAKGQEWRTVFVLNCVDGCIPSDLGTGTQAELDEERRLLYVAMTRARDTLHLVAPQRFYVHGQHRAGDRHVYATRTRFIPPAILDRFDRTTWPLAPAAAPATPRPARTARPSTSPPACADVAVVAPPSGRQNACSRPKRATAREFAARQSRGTASAGPFAGARERGGEGGRRPAVGSNPDASAPGRAFRVRPAGAAAAGFSSAEMRQSGTFPPREIKRGRGRKPHRLLTPPPPVCYPRAIT